MYPPWREPQVGITCSGFTFMSKKALTNLEPAVFNSGIPSKGGYIPCKFRSIASFSASFAIVGVGRFGIPISILTKSKSPFWLINVARRFVSRIERLLGL